MCHDMLSNWALPTTASIRIAILTFWCSFQVCVCVDVDTLTRGSRFAKSRIQNRPGNDHHVYLLQQLHQKQMRQDYATIQALVMMPLYLFTGDVHDTSCSVFSEFDTPQRFWSAVVVK
jgi:hypothetical protein